MPDTATISSAAGFDYGQIDTDAAAEARAAVDRFRQRSETYFMDTGRDLIAVKGRLEHGLFLRWLEAEMGLTARTAQNFMQAAARLGHKSEIVSHLPPTTLYRLAAPSTPDHVRDEVLGLAEKGRIEPRAVDQMAADARARAKEAARLASLSPEAAAAEKKRAQRRRSSAAKRDADDQRMRDEYAKQAEAKEQATHRAFAMIADKFGDDLAALAPLLEQADPWRLRSLISGVLATTE